MHYQKVPGILRTFMYQVPVFIRGYMLLLYILHTAVVGASDVQHYKINVIMIVPVQIVVHV